MKTGLIVIGIIFLVFGAIFYFMPTPSAGATTTIVTPDATNTKTSFASVIVPWQLTMALALIGFLLLLAGLILPDRSDRVRRDEDAKSTYVSQTKEYRETGDGRKHRIVRKRRKQQYG